MTLFNLMGFSLALCVFGVFVLVTVDCTCTVLPVRYIVDEVPGRFTCQATGAEPIKYEWRRKTDGQPWKTMESDSEHYRTVIGGVLTFSRPFFRDEGIYECIASNDQEVAVSRIEIKRAFVDLFPIPPIFREYATVGDYKAIKCRDAPSSYPRNEYSWGTVSSWDSGSPVILVGEEYSVDLNGTLHMLNVRMDDATYKTGTRKTDYYSCVAYNTPGAMSVYGSTTVLGVSNRARGLPYRPPTIKYVSDKVDMEIAWNTKKDITLMCIADGSPNIPKIRWRRHGKDMTKLEEYKDRITFGDYDRKITISNVQDNDTGYYECYIEGNTDIYKKIRVTVRNCDMPRPLHVSIGS